MREHLVVVYLENGFGLFNYKTPLTEKWKYVPESKVNINKVDGKELPSIPALIRKQMNNTHIWCKWNITYRLMTLIHYEER